MVEGGDDAQRQVSDHRIHVQSKTDLDQLRRALVNELSGPPLFGVVAEPNEAGVGGAVGSACESRFNVGCGAFRIGAAGEGLLAEIALLVAPPHLPAQAGTVTSGRDSQPSAVGLPMFAGPVGGDAGHQYWRSAFTRRRHRER
jgi:hypothetical protein